MLDITTIINNTTILSNVKKEGGANLKLKLRITGANAGMAVRRYCNFSGEVSLSYLDSEITKLWLEEQCSILQNIRKRRLNDKIERAVDGSYTLEIEIPVKKSGDIIILQGTPKSTALLPLLSVMKPSSWCYAIITLDSDTVNNLPILCVDHDVYITGFVVGGKVAFGSEITLDTFEIILKQLHELKPPFTPETVGEIALAMTVLENAKATNQPVPRWKYRSHEELTEEIAKIIEMLRLLEETNEFSKRRNPEETETGKTNRIILH